ncbi:hypothetical protein [Haloarchaeobius sp. HME9146]|nr:hypothetical protein [Haloarchaeobius sp. HME9146]MCT9097593.1 hypothetical protein [Haloarchaeobius sp. HME9146]
MSESEETTVHRCGVECDDGTPCQRTITSEQEFCWQHRDYDGLTE